MIYKFMSVAARATLAGDRGSELRRHFSVIELQHYYCPSIWLQVSSHHLTIERMLYWTSIFSSRAIWVRISSGKNYVEPIVVEALFEPKFVSVELEEEYNGTYIALGFVSSRLQRILLKIVG